MTRAKKTPIEEPRPPYEPTPKELEVLKALKDRIQKTKPSVDIKMEMVKGVTEIGLKHDEYNIGKCLLMESLATADPVFAWGVLNQFVNTDKTATEKATNFMLSMVRGIEPRDQLETLLAVQMAAIHNATMDTASRFNTSTTLPQADSAERALNRLARTFAVQIDTLKRYRSTGEQKLTVQHVTVNEGGQAIVGNVTGARGTNKNEDKSHAPSHVQSISNEPGETLSCSLEADRVTMPVTGS
jgi:hypothetical protein